jgi:hypothetical protein
MVTTSAYPSYLNTSAAAMMLSPTTHSSDTTKRKSYPSDDKLAPYTTYGYMPPMDSNAPSPYDQSNSLFSISGFLIDPNKATTPF